MAMQEFLPTPLMFEDNSFQFIDISIHFLFSSRFSFIHLDFPLAWLFVCLSIYSQYKDQSLFILKNE